MENQAIGNEEMSRKEVCDFLGRSDRMVGDYAKDGKLPYQMVKGKTRPVMVFKRSDVVALKEKLETGNTEIVEIGNRNQETRNPKPEYRNPNTETRNPNTEAENSNQGTRNPQSGRGGATALALSPQSGIWNPETGNPETGSVNPPLFVMSAEQFAALLKVQNEIPLEQRPVLNVEEIRLLTKQPERAIREAMKSGALRNRKVGRANCSLRADVDRWLAEEFAR